MAFTLGGTFWLSWMVATIACEFPITGPKDRWARLAENH